MNNHCDNGEAVNDGILRLLLTQKCNARCVFCGQHAFELENPLEMDPVWISERFLPMYQRIKILMLTGGEITIHRWAYDFVSKFCHDYPEVTIMLDTNGIAFDHKWQKLAAENLMQVHFSVNAVYAETYCRGVWAGSGAANAFTSLKANFESYVSLLARQGLQGYGPSMSMVINRNTASDVRSFVSYALHSRAKQCSLYFDYTENNPAQFYFQDPEHMRTVLLELMKMERVLAGKLPIIWRQWCPVAERVSMQRVLDAISQEELAIEYADLLALARERDTPKDYSLRAEIRAQRGKKSLTYEEEYYPQVHSTQVNGKWVCAAPWKMVGIHPDGRVEFCCFNEKKLLRIQDHIRSNVVDWDSIMKSAEYQNVRRGMLEGDYSGCMLTCPANTAAWRMYRRKLTRYWWQKIKDCAVGRCKIPSLMSVVRPVSVMFDQKRNRKSG